MSEESWSYGCSTSTWSSCANDFVMVNDFLEEVRPIVDDIAVKKQSQEFNRGLCSVLLNQRHINIVDEYESRPISSGTNHLFASFFHQFRFNTLLH